MTCVKALLIFVLCSAWGHAANATEAPVTPQQAFTRSFASPRLEMLAEGSPFLVPQRGTYPGWYRTLMTKVLAKNPDSMPKKHSPGCEPDDLQGALESAPSALERARRLDGLFQKCGSEWETGTKGPTANIFRLLRTRLDLDRHPFLQPVMLNLPGGVRLKGLLALKGDGKKRPLVILRLGIFSNVGDFMPERFLLMQLFEQGPANVLVLENSSGADFVANNAGLTLGGPEEALQNLQVARLLRDPQEPLSKLVGSLHLVGASLGGNGLFSTAALQNLQKGKAWIDSYFAFCPVVHLRDTLHHAIRSGAEGTLVDVWISRRLAGVRDRVSSLAATSVGTWWKLRPYYWPEALRFAEAAYPTAPGLREGLQVPPALDAPLWEAAEPWAWWQPSKAPFLVVATREDDIVPVELNAARLSAALGDRAGDLGLAVLREGFHCTLAAAYDWNVISALVNAGTLAGAPGRPPKRVTFDMDLGQLMTAQDLKDLRALTYEIKWPAGGESVELKIHASAGGRTVDFGTTLPRNEFDFVFLNPGSMMTDAERFMLERWLHKNLRVELRPQRQGVMARLSWPQAQAALR
ncbi:MAG: hypothetical protein KF802_12570 [Bdellovibrionaceae bacterium]|nr:hypothetical protein [Pseudobdellovibrionaceae bacterium]MBX3034699.1 hypothetical protein [Pseudobdellovibrionaceae bacterium]